MNAFWALIPVILVRYVLLGLLNKEALKRAAFFPERHGSEKAAYWLYQAATAVLLLYPIWLTIQPGQLYFYLGLLLYGGGLAIFAASAWAFARTGKGFTAEGLYRISRNPMYIGYFLYFLGCAIMTRSLILLATVIVFQISAHWIIRSEERWCIREFGEKYEAYMKKVRRYL